MSSIVQELQRDSVENKTVITELLRKSLLVARKLKIKDFEVWIQKELNGYGVSKTDQIPMYRHLKGSPKAWNPYHGWIPVMFENAKHEEVLSSVACAQPISEIEHMLSHLSPEGFFESKYSPEALRAMNASNGRDYNITLHLTAASLHRIVDSVRNIVLDWTLKLEEDGILGEGISFSVAEIKKAESANYIVNNFHGNISESQLQIGTEDSKQKRKK